MTLRLHGHPAHLTPPTGDTADASGLGGAGNDILVLPANNRRRGIIVGNPGLVNPVYISFGGPAGANSLHIPPGTFWVFPPGPLYAGDIWTFGFLGQPYTFKEIN